MRKFFQACWVMLAATLLTTSCLGSDDDDVTTYDDVAIMSFTLGTLNRYLTTTSSTGADSTYKTTYAGSSYKMNIDHLGGRIFNSDSLLNGTDNRHVLCTITTSNSALVTVKSMTSDSLRVFSSSDSIDFSQARVFRVHSTDGAYTRDYIVSLAVRQMEQGTLLWKPMQELPTTKWTDWQFAYNADSTGIVASNDNWESSFVETLDESAGLLPHNGQFVSWNLANNRQTYALLWGENSLTGDDRLTLWRKVIDNDRPQSSGWVYMTPSYTNPYYLPKGQRYWLMPYANGSVLAIAADGTMYKSEDQGITWMTSSQLVMPTDFNGTVEEATTDADGYIWVKEQTTGRVWRGLQTK